MTSDNEIEQLRQEIKDLKSALSDVFSLMGLKLKSHSYYRSELRFEPEIASWTMEDERAKKIAEIL